MHFRGKVLLAFTLVFVLLTPNAFAASSAIKVGGSCKKVGATAKSGSLICAKSGKKLRWVARIIPRPVATPVVTPAPKFRYNAPVTTEGNKALDAVYAKLEAVSADLYQRSLKVEPPKVEIFSDEPNNPLIEPTRVSALRTSQMMRALWSDYPDIQVYLFRNITWLENGPLKTLCPYIIRNQKLYQWANAGCHKYWVASYFEYEDAATKPWKPPFYTAKSVLMATGSHEAVHLVQVGIENGNYFSFPSWYREGSATVGAELVMTSLPEFSKGSIGVVDDWELNAWSRQRCQPALELWKREIAPDGHEITKSCEYSVGRRMMEYLVARDGSFDQVMNVFKTVPSITFEAAFEKFHGQKLSDFFVEIEKWLDLLGWDKVYNY